MFKKLLLVAILIASTKGLAQESSGHDGNGGFGINCGGKIEILDLYEAKSRYHYTVDLGPATAPVEEKVLKMLDRLERINPTAADRYRQQYQNLWTIAGVLDGLKIIKNNDTLVGSEVAFNVDVGLAIYPESCKLIPLARNVQNSGLEKNIYFIGKYWGSLSNNTKAALILHELIYFDIVSGNGSKSGLTIGVSNSEGVRKMIALLASRESEALTLPDLLKHFMNPVNVDVYDPAVSKTVSLNQLTNNGLMISINGFLFSKVYTDSKFFKMSDDGSYVKLVAGTANNGSVQAYKVNHFLGKDVLMYAVNNGITEFFDKNTPNLFDALEKEADTAFKYPYNGGSLDFIIPKRGEDDYPKPARIRLWAPNKIKQISNLTPTNVTVPFFGNLTPVDQVGFDQNGNISFVNVAEGKQISDKFKCDGSTCRFGFVYENSQLSEMYTNNVTIKNKYSAWGQITPDKASLRLDGTLRCAQIGYSADMKINGKDTQVAADQTIEFDAKEKPIGLGSCKVPDSTAVVERL